MTRHARAVLAVAIAVAAVSAYLARFHLPLRSDLSYLLPRDAPSVRAAQSLIDRMPAKDTNLVVIAAPDLATRAAVAAQVIAGVRAIDADLVQRVESDDAATRAFVRAHAHLYAPLADLELAAAALRDAKARANPLFIDLDDAPAEDPRLAELRARREAAEAKLAKPAFISADGRMQVVVIKTAFPATDIARDRALQDRLDAIAGGVRVLHPRVEVGFAGGITVTLAEQAALVRGVVLSSAITALLVALVLFAYLRSVRLILLLSANLVVATVTAFGVAVFTVGHLNAATAFLGAIIAGNGVNYGILLVARYLEERRQLAARPAMAAALAGTLRPTLVASLGAAIAYAALAVTTFRGFADLAWIGGAGMLVCWLVSYTLLPVLVLRFAATPRRLASERFGALVVRVFGFRRPVVACVAALGVTVAAGAITWRYIEADPFEYDLMQMRSRAADAQIARQWLRRSDEAFGRGLAGVAGQTYIAVESVDAVPGVVAALRQSELVGAVSSVLDAVPPDQAQKLALLAEIRTNLDLILGSDDGALAPEARAQLAALRPADDLRAITAADLPPELAAKLTERDGSIGRIVAVKPGADFDELDGHDLIAFAAAIRAGNAALPAAGPSVLFADVLTQIQDDGPVVLLVAAAGLVLMVLVVVGRSRRAVAVLAATAAGTLAMVAACALAGLKVNFLDFVSLPITLGLGIDYAINVADRAEAGADPRAALRTTGGAVLVCSMTTVIGYASLFVSDNLAIRGFGLASLIGEVTCVVAAFVIVPAIIALPRMRAQLVPYGACATR